MLLLGTWQRRYDFLLALLERHGAQTAMGSTLAKQSCFKTGVWISAKL